METEPRRFSPLAHTLITRLTNTSDKSNRIILNDLRAEK